MARTALSRQRDQLLHETCQRVTRSAARGPRTIIVHPRAYLFHQHAAALIDRGVLEDFEVPFYFRIDEPAPRALRQVDRALEHFPIYVGDEIFGDQTITPARERVIGLRGYGHLVYLSHLFYAARNTRALRSYRARLASALEDLGVDPAELNGFNVWTRAWAYAG